MRLYFVLLFSVMLLLHSSGQSLLLKGRITDAATREPVSYATVEIRSLQTGTTANNLGEFELTVSNRVPLPDTMEVSCLGYDKCRISAADFLQLKSQMILLNANRIAIGEVEVKPKKFKTVTLGILDKKPGSKQVTNVYNNRIGNYFENRKKINGWIKSVRFYLDAEGHPETPFRVRVYDLNLEKNCPGNDILLENLVVSAPGPGWFTVDLSGYHLQFPVRGMFVVMEWINSGARYFFDKEMAVRNGDGTTGRITRKFYGQAIGSVVRQPGMLTWGLTLGNDWIPYSLYSKGYINAMIQAEIACPVE